MKTKNALRKVFLESRRHSFSKSVQTKIQRMLVDFLSCKPFQHIALYHPIRDEIDVFSIVEMLPNHMFYLPRVTGKELVFAHVHFDDILVEGAYGILEPAGEPVEPGLLDLIVVPGVAFTKDGNRLGYGGGFYDRFLESLNCIRVGVCQELLLTDELPVEAHDRKMNYVVTEKEIYESLTEKTK